MAGWRPNGKGLIASACSRTSRQQGRESLTRTLFTNRNTRGDFVREALGYCQEEEPIYIASAFFTEHDLLRSVSARSRRVKLIVRLGFPTSPTALQHALDDPFVDVRFYTDASFHPKLYLFGDRVAYVGSANLTRAASLSNQEILASIGSDDPRFEELAILFGEYWEQASVLDATELEKYRKLYSQHKDIDADIKKLDGKVEEAFGRTFFDNIERDKKRKSKENLFVEGYRRTYQDAVRAFSSIRDAYVAFGTRKVSQDKLPLRLEVDSFFSFVRDQVAKGESWREMPIGWTAARQDDLQRCLERWHTTYWGHLESRIVEVNYPRLVSVFESRESIVGASDDQLFDALLTLHSFHDSLRFHLGGIPGLRSAFFGSNDAVRIRESLTYLVHGKDDLISRMANLIYKLDYKLNNFGTANVQELIGWFNKEDLPVINGRTTKILRYFGFDVRQL